MHSDVFSPNSLTVSVLWDFGLYPQVKMIKKGKYFEFIQNMETVTTAQQHAQQQRELPEHFQKMPRTMGQDNFFSGGEKGRTDGNMSFTAVIILKCLCLLYVLIMPCIF